MGSIELSIKSSEQLHSAPKSPTGGSNRVCTLIQQIFLCTCSVPGTAERNVRAPDEVGPLSPGAPEPWSRVGLQCVGLRGRRGGALPEEAQAGQRGGDQMCGLEDGWVRTGAVMRGRWVGQTLRIQARRRALESRRAGRTPLRKAGFLPPPSLSVWPQVHSCT